jgi:hypothetical protein
VKEGEDHEQDGRGHTWLVASTLLFTTIASLSSVPTLCFELTPKVKMVTAALLKVLLYSQVAVCIIQGLSVSLSFPLLFTQCLASLSLMDHEFLLYD